MPRCLFHLQTLYGERYGYWGIYYQVDNYNDNDDEIMQPPYHAVQAFKVVEDPLACKRKFIWSLVAQSYLFEPMLSNSGYFCAVCTSHGNILTIVLCRPYCKLFIVHNNNVYYHAVYSTLMSQSFCVF